MRRIIENCDASEIHFRRIFQAFISAKRTGQNAIAYINSCHLLRKYVNGSGYEMDIFLHKACVYVAR